MLSSREFPRGPGNDDITDVTLETVRAACSVLTTFIANLTSDPPRGRISDPNTSPGMTIGLSEPETAILTAPM